MLPLGAAHQAIACLYACLHALQCSYHHIKSCSVVARRCTTGYADMLAFVPQPREDNTKVIPASLSHQLVSFQLTMLPGSRLWFILQARPLNMAEVLALLRMQSKAVLEDYLLHQLVELQVVDPALHTELVMLLAETALSLMHAVDPRCSPVHA